MGREWSFSMRYAQEIFQFWSAVWVESKMGYKGWAMVVINIWGIGYKGLHLFEQKEHRKRQICEWGEYEAYMRSHHASDKEGWWQLGKQSDSKQIQ